MTFTTFLDFLRIEGSELTKFKARLNALQSQFAELKPVDANETPPTESEEEDLIHKEKSWVTGMETVIELESFVSKLSSDFSEALLLISDRKTPERIVRFDKLCDRIVIDINKVIRCAEMKDKDDLTFEVSREDLFIKKVYSFGPNSRVVMLQCTFRPLCFILTYIQKKATNSIIFFNEYSKTHETLKLEIEKIVDRLELVKINLDKMKEVTN